MSAEAGHQVTILPSRCRRTSTLDKPTYAPAIWNGRKGGRLPVSLVGTNTPHRHLHTD